LCELFELGPRAIAPARVDLFLDQLAKLVAS
jgi:hypothetical protein